MDTITSRQERVTKQKEAFDLEDIDKRLSLLLHMRLQRDVLKKELYENQILLDAIDLSIADELVQMDEQRVRNGLGLFSFKPNHFLNIKDEVAAIEWLKANKPDLVENKDCVITDDLSVYIAFREEMGEPAFDWGTVYQKPTIRYTPAK